MARGIFESINLHETRVVSVRRSVSGKRWKKKETTRGRREK